VRLCARVFLRDSLRRVVSVFVREFNFWRRWGVVGVVDASVILVVDFLLNFDSGGKEGSLCSELLGASFGGVIGVGGRWDPARKGG